MIELVKQMAEQLIADAKDSSAVIGAVIGLVGVILGASISIIGNIVLYLLTARKERRQEVLKRELDRLYRLEEMAGELTEWAGGYQLNHSGNELRERFQGFMVAAGTFRKYPKLKQAIRDLNQSAMILVDAKGTHTDRRQDRSELEEKYEAFLTELKDVLEGIKA